jgi:hypothetical protein
MLNSIGEKTLPCPTPLNIWELEGVTQKSLCRFRYVDDTFVTWSHGPGKVIDFLNHLNSIHEIIQYTMETERDSRLPFLDIDIYCKPNGSLGHGVY